ncbi:3-oxoadipyl-CoA thiolase, partial [Acinetobacter baumannii]
RERQDAFALSSHRKAVQAQDDGAFAAEIVPLDLPGGGRADRDECPRRDTSLARLAALPAAFVAGGTVTAGNSCPVNDGAAFVLLV